MSAQGDVKTYPFGGLVTDDSLESVSPGAAIKCQNMHLDNRGALTLRKGHRPLVLSPGGSLYGAGLATVNVVTAPGATPYAQTFRWLGANKSLYLVWQYTNGFKIDYADVGEITVSLLCARRSGHRYVLRISKNGVVSNADADGMTLLQAKTFLQTIAGVTVTLPAFLEPLDVSTLPLTQLTVVQGGSVTMPVWYLGYNGVYESISYGGSRSPGGTKTSLYSFYDQHGAASRTLRCVEYGGLSYFNNGLTVLVWDGDNLRPIGVATPSTSSYATLAGLGGGRAPGTYRYGVTFSIKTPQGDTIESDLVDMGTVTDAGVHLTALATPNTNGCDWSPFTNAIGGLTIWGGYTGPGASGIGTNRLFCQGATVGSPPVLDIGDTIAFVDGLGYLITKKVTATGTTGGANYYVDLDSVLSAAVPAGNSVSPNIFINYYRSKIGPTSEFYVLYSEPYDIRNTPHFFYDGAADATLGAEYLFPEASHAPLTIARSDVVKNEMVGPVIYKGSLVVGRGRKIYFSDSANPEYFPPEFAFDIDYRGEPVTSIEAHDDYFLVFTENSTWTVTGELTTGQFTVGRLPGLLGSFANNTVLSLEDGIYSFSRNGLFRYQSAAVPTRLSDPVQSIFSDTGTVAYDQTYGGTGILSGGQGVAATIYDNSTFVLGWAGMYHDPQEDLIVMSGKSALSLVYKRKTKTWSIYYVPTSVSWGAGAGFYDLDGVNGGSQAMSMFVAGSSALYRRFSWDDDGMPIPFLYVSGFDSQSSPFIKKKNTRISLQSRPGDTPPESAISPAADGSQRWGLMNDYRVWSSGSSIGAPLDLKTAVSFTSNFGIDLKADTRPTKTETFAVSAVITGVSAEVGNPRLTSYALEWELPFATKQKERTNG